MSVSLAIMAHPARAEQVAELEQHLPGAEICWDRLSDPWETRRRCLLAAAAGADWHLMIQDDARLCADFVGGAARALEAVSEEALVSFYCGRVQPYAHAVGLAVREALERRLRWIAMEGPLWGVAVAVPAVLAPELVAWGDQLRGTPEEYRLAGWAAEHHVSCWYSVPSLADHQIGAAHPSLLPGRRDAMQRVAWRWIGDASPLEIDWQTEPLRPEPLRMHKGWRRRRPSRDDELKRGLSRQRGWR